MPFPTRAAPVAALLALGLFACGGAAIPEVATEGMEPRVAAAIRSATASVREDPRDAGRWGRLAMTLHAHGLAAPALAAYAEAARLDSADPRFLHLPARLLEGSDPEAALGLADRVLRLDPSFAPALAARARTLDALGRAEAAAAWEALGRAAPDSVEAALAAGRNALADGDPETAAQALERAAALAPEAAAAWSFLAQARRRLGDAEGARRALARARAAADAASGGAAADPDPLLEAVFRLRVDRRGREAGARRASASGDHRAAETIYRSLLADRPEDAGLHYNLGNTLARQGRSGDAEAAYRAALSTDPESSAAMANLANLLARDGRDDEAAALYRRSAEGDPGHLPTLLGASSLHFQRGDLREAERLLRLALARDPEHPAALQGLGQLLATAGRLAQAAATLTRALGAVESRGGPPEARAGLHFLLADAERQRGRRAEALRHLARAEALGMEIPPGFRSSITGTR